MHRQSQVAILTLCAAAALLASHAVTASVPDDATQETAVQGPKVVVNESVKDFGDLPQGVTVTHDYVLENKGSRDLEITQVVPACGCTVAEFDRVIPPGGKGKIHAVIDTSTLAGPSNRDIMVYTNDPNSPRITLSFKTVVKPHLRVHPGYARYQVVHGEETPGIVAQKIWAADGGDFEIVGADSPYPFLAVSFHRASFLERYADAKSDGPQWVVDLNLKYNEAPVGPLAQEVVLHTNHKSQKTLRIPITGFVRPAVWATPNEVDLGEVKLPEKSGFVVVVQNFLTQPMEVTGVDSNIIGLDTSYESVQEGRKYTVEVFFDPNMPKGPFEGSIKIRTNSPKSPVVEVPIRGNVL